MSEKVYVLNVYNTMTGQYELIQVTKEVFQTYRRTKWSIEDSTERSEKEYAQRLGVSQQAIHVRKKRILKKIKNNLDEQGC